MARRRKPVRAQAQDKQLARDGFINTLAYLGEASMLNQANDYERHSVTSNYELLTVMYRENWIAKKIIDMPAEDMTRSWYSVSTEIEQDKIDELMKMEARHNVKQEITNALRWARLYGGSAAVIVIKGQEDMLDQPLDYEMLMPGCFKGLIVVDRTSGLDPSIELEEDMDDPEFGYPKYYNVITDAERNTYLKIHHSRMLFFRGRILPIQEEIAGNYWGASELEHIYEELQKRNATSANVAQLVFQANVAALKMADYGEIMGMGTDKQKAQITAAIEWQNRIRNSFGMMLMGNDDQYEQHPYSFSGLAEVYESFMLDMAGAAEIPATKLYGRAPQGMNATGESDMKNYYEMISGLQERNLRPALEKLLPVMAMSVWGQVPEDMEIIFEPLETTTPAERAQITQQQVGAIVQTFSAGIISQRTALLELQESGKPIGSWGSISDEDIENAESDVDSGEGMQDPMGGMMPGEPEGPQGPEGQPEQKPEVPEPSEGPQEGPQQAPELQKEEEPVRKQEAPEGPQNAKEKPELTGWRKEVLEAAQSGDLEKAKALVKAQKEQPQQDQKPGRHGFLIDALRSIMKRFSRDGGPGSGNFGHKGRPGQRGGSGEGEGSGEENSEKSSEPVAKSSGIRNNSGGNSFVKTIAKKFRETFHAAKAEVAKIRPQDAWRVDSTYTDEDYEKMDCYTTPGGSTVAVHDGDIVSVCKNPGDPSVRGSDLLKFAREKGGNKLDAFGGLYGFYIRNGFEPVSWCSFYDKKGIRPDDWDRHRDKKEPVIFFKYTGKSYEEISKMYGERRQQFVRRVKRSDDYGAAQRARDESMKGE